MTQEAIQLPTTPPLSGADLVANINKALQTLATNFSGDIDPAALAWPYCTWADTGNMLLKRRNAANSDWVTIGPLLTEMAVKTGVNTQTFKVAPSTAADEATAQSQVFGVGQSLYSKTGDRGGESNFTNLTGKPILVAIRCDIASAGNITLLISGSIWMIDRVTAAGATFVWGVVPAGLTYRLNRSAGGTLTWFEYTL